MATKSLNSINRRKGGRGPGLPLEAMCLARAQLSDPGDNSQCPLGAGEESSALDVALDEAAAVMSSFGDPAPFPGRIGVGCKIVCQVQTLAQAKEAAAAGADIIIAQEGTRGDIRVRCGTMGLVPAVVDVVAPIPVVAAGGIADGRGLAAALVLGAAGFSMGTRSPPDPSDCGSGDESGDPGSGRRSDRADTRVRRGAWGALAAIDPGRALRKTFSAHWNAMRRLSADQPAEKAWLATAADDFASVLSGPARVST